MVLGSPGGPSVVPYAIWSPCGTQVVPRRAQKVVLVRPGMLLKMWLTKLCQDSLLVALVAEGAEQRAMKLYTVIFGKFECFVMMRQF